MKVWCLSITEASKGEVFQPRIAIVSDDLSKVKAAFKEFVADAKREAIDDGWNIIADDEGWFEASGYDYCCNHVLALIFERELGELDWRDCTTANCDYSVQRDPRPETLQAMVADMKAQLYDDDGCFDEIANKFFLELFDIPEYWDKQMIELDVDPDYFVDRKIVGLQKNVLGAPQIVTLHGKFHLCEFSREEVYQIAKYWMKEVWEMARTCDHCGCSMSSGYYLGGEFACCDECALALYGGDKKQMMEDLSHAEEDDGDCYYTEWESWYYAY